MTAVIELKLKPWQAPSYALVDSPPGGRQDGLKPLASVHVSELSPDALTQLAEQWLTDLYKKAGKTQNWSFVRVQP